MSTQTDRIAGLNGGLALKAPVRVATTAAITLSGLQTIDGVTLVADDRVLVKDQATASANGIYKASTGTWTRAEDFDGSNDVVNGTRVMVVTGGANALTTWYVSTADPITIGTSSIAFAAIDTGRVLDFANFGGVGDGSTDNTAKFNEAVQHCADNGIYTIDFGGGRFALDSAPDAITSPIRLKGAGWYNTSLIRNYTPDAASDPFLDFQTAYWMVDRMSISSGDGTSTGYAMQAVCTAGNNFGWCIVRDLRVEADQRGAITGSWTRALHFDGNANTQGIREVICDNVHVFDCTDTNGVYFRKAINCKWKGGGGFAGATGNAPTLLVTGSSGNTSQRFNIEGAAWAGSVSFEWNSNSGGSLEVDTALTIDSNSSRCLFSLSGNATVTNNSTTSVVMRGDTIYLAATNTLKINADSLSINLSGDFPEFIGSRTDTHGDNADIAVFRGDGKSDSGATVSYARHRFRAIQDANGAEYGEGRLETMLNGALATALRYGGAAGGLGAGSVNGVGEGTFNVPTAGGYYADSEKIIGIRKLGWGVPTGTLDRTTFDADATQSVSASPTQGEVEAIRDLAIEARRVLAALITDIHADGTDAPHALLDDA